VDGNGRLEYADLRNRDDGSTDRVATSAVFVMIGAEPCTEAVHLMLDLDEAGYIKCGQAAAACEGPYRWPLSDRQPELLEAVGPGVFAAGDVRRRDEARRGRCRRRRARCAVRTPGTAGVGLSAKLIQCGDEGSHEHIAGHRGGDELAVRLSRPATTAHLAHGANQLALAHHGWAVPLPIMDGPS
jgi:hypothetical protein